ncbi:MAG: Gfo/Idh/MocA family oxidoreductase [Acidobacteria bacterium]|nr:Gfo/Idh/MocA family oxidoreductase [Acidobacteriota bacterium]
MNRRLFLGTTALSASRVMGANDRVNVGLIGCGGRGRYVASLMRQAPNTAFVAVADVYDTNANNAREWAGGDAKAFKDFRKLLDMKEVDAVMVSAPDHWHAIPTIMACQAGKDVYVEKPVSLTIREGRAMVNAARKYNRIVCAGTQHRSAKHFPKIAEMIKRGDIGDVKFVRVWNYINVTPNGIGRKPNQEPPAGLDWDFYCGPSPKVPFNPNRFLSTYRQFFDYSGGYITDYGNHRIDTAQQIMGSTAPHTISASGGRYIVKDDGDVPDFMTVTYEFDNYIMTYEGSNLNGFGMGAAKVGPKYYNGRGEYDQPNGICFYGTDGTIFAERISWAIYPETSNPRHQAKPVQVAYENVPEPTKDHAAHFVDCVRSRKTPSADIEIGHRSTSVCLLGNIALKTGKKLKWDAKKEDFLGAPDASALLGRKARKPWDLV